MLGTLSVKTVGQQHDEARVDVPLAFTGGDHGVDHDLSGVGEITELGFPDTKSVGVGKGVSILESENGILGKMGVGCDETAVADPALIEGSDGDIPVGVLLVVEHSMAVREGTALNILSRNTDVVSLGDE